MTTITQGAWEQSGLMIFKACRMTIRPLSWDLERNDPNKSFYPHQDEELFTKNFSLKCWDQTLGHSEAKRL